METYSITYVFILWIISVCDTRPEDGKCVHLDAQICRDLNYNMTLIPNVKMNVDTLDEAIRRVNDFKPLFNVNCFKNLKYFICNMFLPMCQSINGNPTPVYPCREVCEAARVGCEPVITTYSLKWPDLLNCEFLSSVDDKNALCGSPPDIKPVTMRPVTKPPIAPRWITNIEKFPLSTKWISILQQPKTWKMFSKKYDIDELKPYSTETFCKFSSSFVYLNKNNKEMCAERCNAYTSFSPADRKFATAWIATWSIICFLSTLLTVTTFLIDQRRFKYPERPIIFLSFCYNLYSIGYLIRVFQSYDDVICEQASVEKYVITEGMSGTSCTLVFFFLYFFGMASALWWVILSITWFLSAALKWGHEAIEKYSSIFHAVSWTIPTIQTIVALVTRKADPDTLSGLCYIGNNHSGDLLLFVVLPLLLYLLIGTLFLAMGFISLIKIRKELRKKRSTNKLERLMLRIGVFSILYSVPASIVVGCFIYDYNRLKGQENKIKSDFLSSLDESYTLSTFTPKVELFYLRYFMLLVVGVTSGVWIWTSKTLDSWKKLYIGRSNGTDIPEEEVNLSKDPKKNTSSTNRRISSGVQNNVLQPPQTHGSLHGSHINMTNQMYMPPQPRFYYPVTQNAAGFMQAHNLPVSEVSKMDTNSRGFTVTPLTTGDENSQYKFEMNNQNYATLPCGMQNNKQYTTSNSDQLSYDSNALQNYELKNELPSSPKSVSTRSYYSSDGKK